ncbi:MAG: pantoate--beta-alanine ligase [Candidatus Thiodiazotropha sp. DIVDIV]
MSDEVLTIPDIETLRDSVRLWRNSGEEIGFVPTMGNLHEGHLALVKEAKRWSQRIVVSIFVNPMQFGAGEDFEDYPRTLAADRQRLTEAGVDLLFAPAAKTIYPNGKEEQTRVEVPGISDILCGASRPGHFVGVATVVCKLFNMVQPDVALFGEKDFQQLMVIRQMVADLALPIKIIGLKTVREADGLAKSSRNGYLTTQQRALAPKLYQALQQTAQALSSGERDFIRLESEAQEMLLSAGFSPDYYAIRSAERLLQPGQRDERLVVLAAAYLGNTRLIDNLIFE